MLKFYGLRGRIVLAFTLSGGILGLIFGAIFYAYLRDLEDEVLNWSLQAERDDYLARYAQDAQASLPKSALLKSFLGIDQVPENLRPLLLHKPQGIYEFENLEYHVLIAELPGRDDLLYLIRNTAETEPLEEKRSFEVILLSLVAMILVNAWFGRLIAKRLIAPVTSLADQVRDTRPDKLPKTIEGPSYDDEVGVLRDALQDSMNRIAAFIDREQRFTRDASHELRTPVTAAKGALELIEKRMSKGLPIDFQLRRLHRAVKNMENMIETFLYLGREVGPAAGDQTCDLTETAVSVVEQNRYLLEEKQVEVVINLGARHQVKAPEPVVAIALGNLVRNAFQYTNQGQVEIQSGQGWVEVRDTGLGISPELRARITEPNTRGETGEGFGLGLSIVANFCRTYNWRLDLAANEGGGTVARLTFSVEVDANMDASA